jgi:hypothetical protein
MRIREAANANPATVCWRCGKTIQDHRPHRSGRPAFWTAGHLRDGDASSPLAPEASTCNYRAGNALQRQAVELRSREW